MKKLSITSLVAAAVLTIGGVAIAQTNGANTQTNPNGNSQSTITSTAGNGCTATANAIKGGNIGGTPSAVNCNGTAAPVAAAPMAPAPMAAAPVTTTTTTAVAPTYTPPAATATPPMRVARADRN